MALNLLCFLLLEQDLVFVVDLGLSQSLVALVTHILESLFEAHLFGVVELLEVGELLLRVHVNFIDLFLQLGLLFFELLFKFSDLLLEAFLGGLDSLLVLLVLFLAKGQVLISLFLSSLEGLS